LRKLRGRYKKCGRGLTGKRKKAEFGPLMLGQLRGGKQSLKKKRPPRRKGDTGGRRTGECSLNKRRQKGRFGMRPASGKKEKNWIRKHKNGKGEERGSPRTTRKGRRIEKGIELGGNSGKQCRV